MTEEQIQSAIHAAIDGIKKEPRPLDFGNVHERSIAHRLAVHMEPYFHKEWDVDCEYDREEMIKKELMGIKKCLESRSTDFILPDIIVHHRREEGRSHNLLVIEIKKGKSEDICDRKKLELLTKKGGHYCYQFGLYINVDCNKFTCTWYRDGNKYRVSIDDVS